MRDQLARRLITALGLLALACPARAENLLETPVDYQVLAVDGQFHSWDDVAGEWRPVARGDTLTVDSLVQSSGKGSLRLKRRRVFERAKTDAGEVSVASQFGVMARLGPDLLRDVVTTSTYADTFSAPPADKEKKAVAAAPSLKSAWERTNALFLAQNAPDAMKKGQRGTGDAGQKGKARRQIFDMIFPKNGSILVTDRLPAVVAIRWTSSPKASTAPWDVFVSDGGAAAPLLLGSTSERYLVVPIYQAGSHTLKVLSRDGTAESEPANVYVLVTSTVAAGKPAPRGQ